MGHVLSCVYRRLQARQARALFLERRDQAAADFDRTTVRSLTAGAPSLEGYLGMQMDNLRFMGDREILITARGHPVLFFEPAIDQGVSNMWAATLVNSGGALGPEGASQLAATQYGFLQGVAFASERVQFAAVAQIQHLRAELEALRHANHVLTMRDCRLNATQASEFLVAARYEGEEVTSPAPG